MMIGDLHSRLAIHLKPITEGSSQGSEQNWADLGNLDQAKLHWALKIIPAHRCHLATS